LFNSCYPRLAGWVRRLIDDDDTAHEIADCEKRLSGPRLAFM